MNFNKPITRRESIKKMAVISGGVALSGAAQLPLPVSAESNRFIVEGIGQTEGYAVKDLTRKVFEEAGGIKQFISKGDVVVVKPNVSWAQKPQYAATTHPEVLETVIELCLDAGAKKVRIVDHTIHKAQKCFMVSGAAAIAEKTGADLVFPRSSLMRRRKIRGNSLDEWPVYIPVIEADKLINLPVAKHHDLTGVTLGMKNWIGAVGGNRGILHQDIHQVIVDLAQFFKPTVTLIDAIRVMTRNGPSGGSTSYVAVKNTLILSDDPVAADAKAALIFNRKPKRLGFIRLAQKHGLGTYHFEKLNQKRVTV